MASQAHGSLLVEILKKLRMKNAFNMRLVSQEWALLIESSFLLPPKVLYTHLDGLERRKFKIIPNDRRPWPYKETLKLVCPSSSHEGRASQPIRGLICIHFDDRTTHNVEITNFFTGKSVKLPSLQKDVRDNTSMFFGLDFLADQFKLLCVCESNGLPKPRVFCLQGKKSLWKSIYCGYLHSPVGSSSGIYMNGFIYYGAWNPNGTLFVMSFNLNKEVFSPIKMPTVITNNGVTVNLVKHLDFLAVVIRRHDGSNGFSFEMHVMEDAQKWTMLNFLIHGSSTGKCKPHYCIGSTESSGVIFSPDFIFDVGFTKKQRPFHKIELQLNLCCFHPIDKGHYNVHTWDKFTEEIGSLTYIGLQTFVGAVVSYINPKRLLA